MAAIFNGPARGGNRGGKDQFNWEDVKEDKYNQNYLGHSVKAPIGRWQKGRDLHWYNKNSKIDLKAAQENERNEIKAKEQDLMLQLLGEKPMEPAPRSNLDRIQKNKLLKKGDAEEGTVAAAISQDDFGERVEGIGYAPIKIDDLRQAMETSTSTRLEGTGINDLLAAHAAGEGEDRREVDDHAALLAAIEADGAGPSREKNDSGTGGEHLSKEERKERKRLKKEMKKVHKAEKADRKAAKSKSKLSEPDSKRARAADFMRVAPDGNEKQASSRQGRLASQDFRRPDGAGDVWRHSPGPEDDRRGHRDSLGRSDGRGRRERSRSRGPGESRRSRSGERRNAGRDRGRSVERERDGRWSRSQDRTDEESRRRHRDFEGRSGRGPPRSRSRSWDGRRSPRR